MCPASASARNRQYRAVPRDLRSSVTPPVTQERKWVDHSARGCDRLRWSGIDGRRYPLDRHPSHPLVTTRRPINAAARNAPVSIVYGSAATPTVSLTLPRCRSVLAEVAFSLSFWRGVRYAESGRSDRTGAVEKDR